jgi:hypothetical protein
LGPSILKAAILEEFRFKNNDLLYSRAILSFCRRQHMVQAFRNGLRSYQAVVVEFRNCDRGEVQRSGEVGTGSVLLIELC